MNTDACNEEDINIPISQSVCRCLLSHSLKIVFAFFALDHSAYSRMIGIFNDISDVCDGVRIHLVVINKKSIRVLCEYNRSPCSIFNQFIRFPLLRRPSFINIPCLSSLMRKRSQRVVPFYDAAQFESSEEVDFHVWFSPIFLRGIHVCEEYRLSFPAWMLSSRYWSWICDGVQTDCTSNMIKVLDEIVRNKHIVLWWRINGIASRMTLKSSEVQEFLLKNQHSIETFKQR